MQYVMVMRTIIILVLFMAGASWADSESDKVFEEIGRARALESREQRLDDIEDQIQDLRQDVEDDWVYGNKKGDIKPMPPSTISP